MLGTCVQSLFLRALGAVVEDLAEISWCAHRRWCRHRADDNTRSQKCDLEDDHLNTRIECPEESLTWANTPAVMRRCDLERTTIA